jgi:hypothetical protein
MRIVQAVISERTAVPALPQDGHQTDEEEQQGEGDIDREPLARGDSL